jgi:hypothetical protein
MLRYDAISSLMPAETCNKVPFQLNWPDDLLDLAREVALKDGRTLSNWIERVLRDEFSKPSPSKAK